jgi:hypothetical protein
VRRTSAADEQRVLELKQQGRSQREIAGELEMPRATVAAVLKRSPGYVSPRGSGGRISAYKAAQQFGLKPATLNAAIDVGLVRGEAKQNGAYVSRTVAPAELKEDIEERRKLDCTYPGCGAKALPLSLRVRCEKHTGDVTLPGATFDAERRSRMAPPKRSKERPDVRERVDAMHADKKQRRAWHVKTLEGRKNGRRTMAKRSDEISGTRIRNAKNRLNGLKDDAHRPRNDERDWYQAAVDKVLELHGKNKQLGARTLATRVTRALRESGALDKDAEVTRYFVDQVLDRS